MIFANFSPTAPGIPRERVFRALAETAPPDASILTRTAADLQRLSKSSTDLTMNPDSSRLPHSDDFNAHRHAATPGWPSLIQRDARADPPGHPRSGRQ